MTGPDESHRAQGFAADPHQVEDLHAWQVLRPLLDAGRYLPWTTGTMRPAGMVVACNEIVHRRRRRIVECGSGVSTVVFARLLRELGAPATITSLEHDAGWADLVNGWLRAESLDGIARVLHAPLEGDPPWYARTAVGELPAQIDLLVVDGPPAFEPGHGVRRAPALPVLGPILTSDATVVLDDAQRPGEREVVARWESTTPWRFTVTSATGLAVGTRSISTSQPAR